MTSDLLLQYSYLIGGCGAAGGVRAYSVVSELLGPARRLGGAPAMFLRARSCGFRSPPAFSRVRSNLPSAGLQGHFFQATMTWSHGHGNTSISAWDF